MRLSILSIILCFFSCSSGDQFANNEAKKLLEKYGKGVFSTIYMDRMTYSEKVSLDNRYLMYNEGYGYMLSMGCDNVPIALDNFCFVLTNFKKSSRAPEWLDIATVSKDPTYTSTDIQPGYNQVLNTLRRFELFGPFHPEHFDDFEYNTTKTPAKNKEITFVLKSNPESHGTIFYNDQYQISKAVLNNFRFYNVLLGGFGSTGNTVQIQFASDYQHILLSSIDVSFKKEQLHRVISTHFNGTPSADFKLTPRDWNTLSLNDICPFIKYKKSAKNKFLADDIEKIRADLEKAHGTTLEEQFIENSGKLYFDTYDVKTGKKINQQPITSKIIDKLNIDQQDI